MSQSEQIDELAKALSKAQSEFPAIKRSAHVEYQTSKGIKKYDYAPLADVFDAIRKVLSDNELAITQPTYMEDGMIVIRTILTHGSGQWISGDMSACSNVIPQQEKGSAITYTRRYSLAAILGIAPDEDDDAESTKEKKGKKIKSSTRQTGNKASKQQGAKKFDTTTLEGALDFLENKEPKKWGHPIVAARISDKYGVTGDTMKELIELLDPEQKKEFVDIVSQAVVKLNP